MCSVLGGPFLFLIQGLLHTHFPETPKGVRNQGLDFSIVTLW